MGFEMVKENYTGSIKAVKLGQGDKAVTVGGESCLPFHAFEGEIPNPPKIAMEVWDMEPKEWPEAATAPFKDCLGDPAAWAKKCVQEYGADMISLQMRSTGPNDQDASADEAVATVKKVLDAVDVPVIVWGTAAVEKDAEVLKKIAEQCEGANLAIGPIEDANHKSIGAGTMGFGHTAIASSPIDINLAKQINILLENLGMPLSRVIIDPTTGGLGYGMEYSYSVMERIKLAALTFGDDKLQLPLYNNLAFEVWKCKEAKMPVDENPLLGDPERRGVLMESVAAVSYLMAGSNVLTLRHPESVRLVRSFIQLMVEGGKADQVGEVNKLLDEPEIDYLSMSPEVDLTIEEEKKPAAPKKEEKPKAEAKPEAKPEPKAEAKPEPKTEAKPEPKAEEKPAAEAKPEAASAAQPSEPSPAAAPAVDEAKIRAEIEAKVRKEMEDTAKAEEEAKAKAEQAKKEAEEKARQEAEEKARKLEQDAQEIRNKVAKAKASPAQEGEKKAEPVPESVTERIVTMLDRFHRRAA
ncbi:MAG: acetyl-CoA decarbonylase/synthase complex subunit delta [Desulfovermiculus sp.]|nr:acetyl-CoA decarbonylase/synthase complex subunit delta [Desulfovermiculus sp.]